MLRCAKHFLDIANEHHEKVSAYFEGSDKTEDIEAYNKVKEAEKQFMHWYNMYFDTDVEDGLNYDLAEYVLSM